MGSVTKTYIQVENTDKRVCNAAVPLQGSYDTEPFTDVCGKSASFCLDIHTISLSGRKIVSKVGFCSKHIPRKYREWFKLPSFSGENHG